MFEDDIQYIGTRPARAVSNHPFQGPQRVTGIILHVEKSGAEAARHLVFRKANTNVVHIGRRSADSDSDFPRGDNELLGGAMFRCAVVSRKHAKIAFSDSGPVYLIDLNSHHGTHVRKPEETVSRMLKPESPTVLADGDIITFGKSVEKRNDFVHPVVARVELLLGSSSDHPHTSTGFKPLHLVHADNIISTNKTPSSGRYGVYVIPDSRGSTPSHADRDSDIEEIAAPASNGSSASSSSSSSSSSSVSSSASAPSENQTGICSLNFLRRIFEVPTSPSSLRDRVSPPPPQHPGFHQSHDPSPGFFSQPAHPYLPPINAPLDFMLAPYPYLYDPPRIDDVYEEDATSHQSHSRSTSPMDLASPSPGPSSLPHLVPASPDPASNVPGEWPASESRPVSPPPVHQSALPSLSQIESESGNESGNEKENEPETSAVPNANAHEDHNDSQVSIDVESNPGSSPLVVMPATPTTPAIIADPPLDRTDAAPPAAQAPSVDASLIPDGVDSAGISEMKSTLQNLQSEVAKLQLHRRKFKCRYNANLSTITDKLTDLDYRVTDTSDMYSTLSEQLDRATDVELPELQARILDLVQQADADMQRAPTFDEAAFSKAIVEREDVKACVSTLNELVNEMKVLRETTEKQMAAELDAVKAARVEALAAIAVQPQPPLVSNSLKRKRYEDEAEDELAAAIGKGVDAVPTISTSTVGIDSTSSSTLTTKVSADGVVVGVPALKRARVVRTIVHTATAVGVGAIAAWSALAFA